MSLYESQLEVKDFMQSAHQGCPSRPTVPALDVQELRHRLMREELDEFARACTRATVAGHVYSEREVLTEVADALADLMYVTLGAAVAFGIDLAPVFAEVHRSNMEKFKPGGYRRPDGKWMKPPGWTAPNIEAIVGAQMV